MANITKSGMPSVRFKELAVKPASPPAGYRRLYNRAGVWYSVDSAGTETQIGNTGGIFGPDGAMLTSSGTLTSPGTQIISWSTETYDTDGYFDSILYGPTVMRIPVGKAGLFYISATLDIEGIATDTYKRLITRIDNGVTTPKIKASSEYHTGTSNKLLTLSTLFPAYDGDEVYLEISAGDTGSLNWTARVNIQRITIAPSLPTGGTGTGTV